MTMLDRMRRHKSWLKWSLALVVLTFVVFYIPDFLTPSAGAAPSEVLAEVEGEPLPNDQIDLLLALRRKEREVQRDRS